VTEKNVKHETLAIEQCQARASSEEAKSFLPDCGMLLEAASIDDQANSTTLKICERFLRFI